jgi:copper chaperone CopZ
MEFRMKKIVLVLISLFWLPIAAWAAEQVVVDIGVTGLACPFCVYSVEKNLGKLPEVDSVEVNLVADSPGRNLIKVFLKFGPRHLGFCDLETIRSMISINSAIFNNDVSMQVFKWKLVHLYSGTTFTE